ncbi:MAG: hypothetical protein GYB67_09065 [Chloroflexi bacterium]|nr:hypothetical protein [Chloroflexota bacterium]
MRPFTAAVITTAILAAGIVVITGVAGSLLGSRSAAPRPVLSVIEVIETDRDVSIIVRNNELYTASGSLWYTLESPTNGEVAYTAAPVTFSQLTPRSERSFSLPRPPAEIDAGEWVLRAWASEQIANVEAGTFPLDSLTQRVTIASDAAMEITNAALVPQPDGYTLQADLRFVGDAQAERAYRYTLSLAQVVRDESSGLLLPQARSYLSDFQALQIGPNEVVSTDFSDAVTLPAGEFTLSLWVQLANADGVFEHYTQFTYGEILQTDSSGS